MVSAVLKYDSVTTRPKQDKQNMSIMSLSLFLHLFSFLEKDEVSNCARVSVSFMHSSKKYADIMMKKRLAVWTHLLQGEPTRISASTNLESLTINMAHISFQVKKDLHFFSTTGKEMSKMSHHGNKISGGPIDEKVSVYPKYSHIKTVVHIIDNEQQRELQKVTFSKSLAHIYNKFVALFGTDKKNQTLEFMTSKGDMLIHNPSNSTKCEYHFSESNRNKTRICCVPRFPTTLVLRKAFKVKSSYYFLWTSPETLESIISFMKDKKSSNDHTVIISKMSFQSDAIADDNFLYTVDDIKVIILKTGNIWKSFSVPYDTTPPTRIVLHPSNYAFIVECISSSVKSKKKSYVYSINHFNKIEMSLIGESRKRIYGDRTFVHKDILMLNTEKDQWSIFHLLTKSKITTLNFPEKQVHKIGGAENPLPGNFVVFLTDSTNDFSDNIIRDSKNPCVDVFFK